MIEQVDAERLRDLTLALVEVESPTGQTAEVASLYAGRLAQIGMEVELIDDVFPETPTVVGRLRGGRSGPRIVLNGHLDTVPIAHDPPRVEGELIYGRGAADMKGACACAAEAAAALAQGDSFAGELVIVAIGLHEAPGGRGEDLAWLLGEHGFTADMAIVCELSPPGSVVVSHMGQATAEITISRPGAPTHELLTPKGTPHPLLAAARAVEAIRARTEELAALEHPWVGAETYFVGEVHGGDFYNRFPATARIVGTRRFADGNTLEAVEEEYRSLLERVAAETGCTIDLELKLVRGPYSISSDHPLLIALQEAYSTVTGEELTAVGTKTVADGAIFTAAGIPTVYHGPSGEGAHADLESIAIPELVRATKVYITMLERLLG
ncbi:MAG TPA: M20 family metallopeptidase [Gaiellaceae bacterium]|nr:M20 family metallopeptidase [Gaiellaceae bacterium]